ncbi:MAG: hypothetical protein OEV44_03830 [Spirochaetota bacterium]|nr:hypothetical protein [Spirochaetota bacterium]
MGLKKIIFLNLLLVLILIAACSPNIGQIGDKSISYNDFISSLQKYEPKYFGKKRAWIEKQIYDWKRLKSALIDYYNNEVVWKELQEKDFSKSINKKKINLFYLGNLGEFTKILFKQSNEKINLQNLKNKTNIIFNKSEFEKNLFETTKSNSKENQTSNILIIENDLILSMKEIKDFFPKKKGLELKDFIENNLLPNLYAALEGKRLKYNNKLMFKELWKVKWRNYLIYLYENEIRTRITIKIINSNEKKLKDYYDKNKNQFTMIKPKTKNKNDSEREKYQFSYNQVRDDVAKLFVDKKITQWKNDLWKKYKFSINDKYFKSLEDEELAKLHKTTN